MQHTIHSRTIEDAGKQSEPAGQHACCNTQAELHPSDHSPLPSAHAHHGHAVNATLPGLTTSATLHCLTGCAIGEFAGLAIGVSLGFDPWTTMLLATGLGFTSGYTLGLVPLVRQGLGWLQAFKTIWIGETISIAVMEFAMNFTDYHVGGVQAPSVLSSTFWLGYAAALGAGFLAAWPANYWLLKRNVKQPCH